MKVDPVSEEQQDAASSAAAADDDDGRRRPARASACAGTLSARWMPRPPPARSSTGAGPRRPRRSRSRRARLAPPEPSSNSLRTARLRDAVDGGGGGGGWFSLAKGVAARGRWALGDGVRDEEVERRGEEGTGPGVVEERYLELTSLVRRRGRRVVSGSGIASGGGWWQVRCRRHVRTLGRGRGRRGDGHGRRRSDQIGMEEEEERGGGGGGGDKEK